MQIVLDYIIENKKKLLIIFTLFIFIITVSFLINFNERNKIYRSDPYVYTKDTYKHSGNMVSFCPFVNIKGDYVKSLNDTLLKKYYEVTTIDEQVMDYEYYKNGSVLSLVVKIFEQEEFNQYPGQLYVYNIDVLRGREISNDDLLNKFNVTSSEVSDIIKNDIRNYYDYEVKMKTVDASQCDFSCYLANVGGLSLDDCLYYVKDNYLMAYKKLSLNDYIFYDNDSEINLFNFIVKKIK